jgi:hypothetical protein
VTFNVGATESSATFGDVDIAKRPELVAANLVSTAVVDLVFDVAVSSNSVFSTLISDSSNISFSNYDNVTALWGGAAGEDISATASNNTNATNLNGGVVFLPGRGTITGWM